MKKFNIVWSSVVATTFGLLAFVPAYYGSLEWVIALGFASLSASTLSARER